MKKIEIVLVAALLLSAAPVAAQVFVAPEPAPLFIAPSVSVQSVPQEERHAGWLHAAVAAHAVAQFSDVSTTAFAMGRGGFYEHNPIMRPFAGDPIKLAVVKGAYAVGTSYLFLKLGKTRPKTAILVAAGHAAFSFVIAAKNSRTIKEHRP